MKTRLSILRDIMTARHHLIRGCFATLSLTALLAFSLASCSDMIDELGSERRAEAAKDLGNAFVADAIYYYDGEDADDAAALAAAGAQHGSHMLVEFTQPVVVSEKGLSGSVVMTWQEGGAANTDTVDISDMGAMLNSATGKCQIDMKQALVHAGASDNGTVNMTLKLGGLLCASGSQSGRGLPVFEQKIAVAPFWSGDIAFMLTRKSTLGRNIVLPTAGGAEVVPESFVTGLTETTPTLTTGLVNSDFNPMSDGGSAVLRCTRDLVDGDFVAEVNVGGIRPLLSKEAYSKTFSLSCAPLALTLPTKNLITGDFANVLATSKALQSLGEIGKITITVHHNPSSTGWATITSGATWDGDVKLVKDHPTSTPTNAWQWVVTDPAAIAALAASGINVTTDDGTMTADCVVEALDPLAPTLTVPRTQLVKGKNMTITVTGPNANHPVSVSDCTFAIYTDSVCSTLYAGGKVRITNGVISADSDAVTSGTSPLNLWVRAVNKADAKAFSNVLAIDVLDKAIATVPNDAAHLGAAADSVAIKTGAAAGIASAAINNGNVEITAVGPGDTIVECSITGATTHAEIPVHVNDDMTEVRVGEVTKWVTREKEVKTNVSVTIAAIVSPATEVTPVQLCTSTDIGSPGGIVKITVSFTVADNAWGTGQGWQGIVDNSGNNYTGAMSWPTGGVMWEVTDATTIAAYKAGGISIKANEGFTSSTNSVTLTYVP